MDNFQKQDYILNKWMPANHVKGVKGKFTPKTSDGENLNTVPAYINGDFAVTKDNTNIWHINHIQSGTKVLSDFKTKRQAEQFLGLISTFDWDLRKGVPEPTNIRMKLVHKGLQKSNQDLSAELFDILDFHQ